MFCLILLLTLVVLTLADEDDTVRGPDRPGISRTLRHYESLDELDDTEPDAGGDRP